LTVACVIIACVVGMCVCTLVLFCLQNDGNDYKGTQETKFIAHRGLSIEYYQNSLTAFEKAGQESFFWGIETDIWRTKDGKWVCCHNENPFADDSVKVYDITLAEAQTLALDPHKNEEASLRGENTICTYEEYLQTCATYGKAAVIELKATYKKSVLQEVVDIAFRYLPSEKLVFISFQKANVDRIEAMDGTIQTQLLLSSGAGKFWMNFYAAAGYTISIPYGSFTEDMLTLAHDNHAVLDVWTINDEETAQKYIDMGVDYLESDRVLVLNP